LRSRQAQALPRLQSSTSPLHDHATPHHRTPPRHLRNTTSNRLKGGEEEEEKKNTSRNKQRNLYITPHHQNNPHTDRPNPKENKLVCLPVHTWCVLLANVPCACAIMHIGTKNGNTHALIHCAKRKTSSFFSLHSLDLDKKCSLSTVLCCNTLGNAEKAPLLSWCTPSPLLRCWQVFKPEPCEFYFYLSMYLFFTLQNETVIK